MTLTITFGVAFLIGIGFIIWDKIDDDYTDWKPIMGWSTAILMAIAIAINLPIWISSAKDSEIKYNQLIAEKTTIESMLETDKDVDRFLLNSAVIDYNNRIISNKSNCNRFILKDYYNQDLDWSALELIEWR